MSKVECHLGNPNAYFVRAIIPQSSSAPAPRSAAYRSHQRRRTQQGRAPMVQYRSRSIPIVPSIRAKIMRGAVTAEMDGRLAAYVDAVCRHMREEARWTIRK
jgi:hypothetical protein